MICRDDTDKRHIGVYVESKVDCSHGKCRIGSSPPSTQHIIIENEFYHPIFVDIDIEALNQCVEFEQSNTHQVSTTIRVPRYGFQKSNRPGRRRIPLDLRQVGTGIEEEIEVVVKYAFGKNDAEEEKSSSVPAVIPIVRLT